MHWVLITDTALQLVLGQDPVLAPASPALVPALNLVALLALEALLGQLHSTRTSSTNSEPRSWLIRCWLGGNHCQTTSRWLSKGRGRCLGCSSPYPVWLLELQVGQEVDQQDQDQDLAQWAQAIADLMVSLHGECQEFHLSLCVTMNPNLQLELVAHPIFLKARVINVILDLRECVLFCFFRYDRPQHASTRPIRNSSWDAGTKPKRSS